MRKIYKKINIYTINRQGFRVYECSTLTYKTCKDAKTSFLKKHNYLSENQIKASYK
jgi:hypothetical protein